WSVPALIKLRADSPLGPIQAAAREASVLHESAWTSKRTALRGLLPLCKCVSRRNLLHLTET
ncbi:MAG: hypothetical protein M3220_18180, partial [Chloroflexota bacterium]|nr:hypothetical protein [Chloroflexota bacterium]